jgi:uncharacterized membrane protein
VNGRVTCILASSERRVGGSLRGMATLTNFFVALVALLHVYFMVLEMFLWTKPAGRRAFGLTAKLAEASKALAANQGLSTAFWRRA